MKDIRLQNKIAKAGTDRLDPSVYRLSTDAKDPEGILVRSADLHGVPFGENLLAIARAGAGVNNIPVEECSARGIVVFNTPGANANAVKELTLCALFLASRDIVGGIGWVRELTGHSGVAAAVEAGKSRFSGCEVYGKTLGVIGLGAIGGAVANAAVHLGMNVIGYDPYISVKAAWNVNHHVRHAGSFDEVFAAADYLTLHVPATGTTCGMICRDSLNKMKPGVRILNLARADLVVADDMKDALAAGKVAAYVTDFPTDEIAGMPGVVTIPHLGASTEESEEHCAVMAADELDGYLRFGNIRNSVNYPNVSLPMSGTHRLCVLHANIPAVLSHITTVVSGTGANIENLINQSKGQNAYTLIDINTVLSDDVLARLGATEGVVRIRFL